MADDYQLGHARASAPSRARAGTWRDLKPRRADLEGISWGYSPMFLHNTPDKEITLSVKVNLNTLIMIKQSFRENPTLSQCLNELDIKSLYLPRESFLTTQSALSLIVDLDKR